MGYQNIEGFGTFRKMDKQSVTGFFKAAGTRDPDILLMKKQTLIAPNRNMKIAGIGLTVLGVLMTLTIIMAILGIPLVLFGAWMWWFTTRNISVVEAVYSEYTAADHA